MIFHQFLSISRTAACAGILYDIRWRFQFLERDGDARLLIRCTASAPDDILGVNTSAF